MRGSECVGGAGGIAEARPRGERRARARNRRVLQPVVACARVHPGADLNVVPLEPPHLGFTARLHLDALRSGLFPRLGPRFLRSYHRTFIDSPHGVALLAEHAGRPAGFLLGTVDNTEHYRWVLRHRGLRLAAVGLLAALARPRVLLDIVRTRAHRYVRGAWLLARARSGRVRPTAPAATTGGAPRAVLAHVAVSSDLRGRGGGAKLERRFVEEVQRAAPEASMHVVAPCDDGGATGFYQRQGWELVRETVDVDGHAIALLRLG